MTGDLDTAAVLARRDDFVSHYDDAGQVDFLEKPGVSVLHGRGRLIGPRRVAVSAPD